MTIGRICIREVDTADPEELVRAAAQRMGTRGVGTLLVLDSDKRPIGILTDRDLTIRVLGAGRDPGVTSVADVMSDCVHTAFEEMPIEEALRLMRAEAVRRLVVVRKSGALVGIVSLDDVLALLAEEFREVGRLLEKEDPKQVAATA
jgi:CBS domain-containing protein